MWFDLTCQEMQKNLLYTIKFLIKFPKIAFLRRNYFQVKRKYKIICRNAKRRFDQNLSSTKKFPLVNLLSQFCITSLKSQLQGKLELVKTSEQQIIFTHSLSLIKNFIKKGQYIYLFLVDFRRSFNSACREGLMLKLEKEQITGKFMKVMNFMYV